MRRLTAVAGLIFVTGTLCASPITLTFTQYFDYPGIPGRPAVTLTAVFDLAVHPTSPFAASLPSLNADFISDGLILSNSSPSMLFWDGDKILSASTMSVRFGGSFYLTLPRTNPFDHCSQPCLDIESRPDTAMTGPQGVTFVDAKTPDVFVGTAASVPEPSSFAFMLLGFAVLSAIPITRRPL